MRSDESKVRLAPWLAEALVRQGKLDEAIGVLQRVPRASFRPQPIR